MSKLNESPLATRRANGAGFASAVHWACYLVSDGWAPYAVQDITGLPWSTVSKVFRAHPDRAGQWRDQL
jgi:hypothetical protein